MFFRQRLEVKDKREVRKASYKCTGCKHQYDSMEMDKIFNTDTQELRCCRCRHVVVPDETGGPNEETRSSLARFNEQMAQLYSMLQSLDGIRLAQHLLEPSLKLVENAQSEGPEREVSKVGEVAFKENGSSSRSSLYQNAITIEDPAETAFAGFVDDPLALSEAEAVGANPVGNEIENLLVEEFDQEPKPSFEEPLPKAPKVEAVASEDSDDEETVTVADKKYYLDEITPELVHEMTPAERDAYINLTREEFGF